MTDHEQGSKDLTTGERMATLAGATADAVMHKVQGEHETDDGARQTVELATVEQLISDWPAAPKRGAQQMIERYGPPNEATPTKLFWYRNGPWKRTSVTRDVVTHNFPAPHSDYLTQATPRGVRKVGGANTYAAAIAKAREKADRFRCCAPRLGAAGQSEISCSTVASSTV